jgi:hypothetical protein
MLCLAFKLFRCLGASSLSLSMSRLSGFPEFTLRLGCSYATLSSKVMALTLLSSF